MMSCLTSIVSFWSVGRWICFLCSPHSVPLFARSLEPPPLYHPALRSSCHYGVVPGLALPPFHQVALCVEPDSWQPILLWIFRPCSVFKVLPQLQTQPLFVSVVDWTGPLVNVNPSMFSRSSSPALVRILVYCWSKARETGINQKTVSRLQKVQKCAARLITNSERSSSITPVLKE